jgi:2-polyprenyl-6-methoxyphenol hydroxylase-like FAD-dependent oxidoreductase
MTDPAQKNSDADTSYDVAIVGYGPVGQLLATLLGQRGHHAVVIERYADIYPMPRAVHFDHEVARILQAVDIRSDTNPIIEPYDNWYEWRNAARETLLEVDWRGVGPSWWHTSNFFAQPDLERELDHRARRQATVTIRRGLTATALKQDDTGVSLTVHAVDDPAEPETIRARYLIGCDGANSTIRQLLDIDLTDLGFFFDWLILDMTPNEPMSFDPPAWQLCDPARPTTIVPGGPGRRRWEFMALPGEDIKDLNRAETAWQFLQPWGLTPDNAVLERHTVYRFQAHWAQQWRAGRALIAGDAAHLMPPFAGQGMCAGLRDVFNLVWKLDLVLRGDANDSLLDAYGAERSPHVRHFIDCGRCRGRGRSCRAEPSDCSAANRPPPGPGRMVSSPRACRSRMASLNVPTDTPHWARSSSLEPSRSPAGTACAISASRPAAISARDCRGARSGRAAKGSTRSQSPRRSAGSSSGAGDASCCLAEPAPGGAMCVSVQAGELIMMNTADPLDTVESLSQDNRIHHGYFVGGVRQDGRKPAIPGTDGRRLLSGHHRHDG